MFARREREPGAPAVSSFSGGADALLHGGLEPSPGACLHLYGRMCSMSHMATNLAIDDKLLEEALCIGGHRTKKATVTEALEEYIQRRKQTRVLELFGHIDFDPKYDYKKARWRS